MMNSQEQITRLTDDQLEVISKLINGSKSYPELDEFSQLVRSCSQLRLSHKFILQIDAAFSEYDTSILRAVSLELNKDNIQIVPGLVKALHMYQELLCYENSELSSLRLHDITGFIVLSVHIVEILVYYVKDLATQSQPAHSPDKLKPLWKSTTELVLKLVTLLEKHQSPTADSGDVTFNLSNIVQTLAAVGRDIADIETKTMILIYKCVLRLITKNCALISDEKTTIRVVECISTTISHSITQYISSQNKQAVVKVLGFLIRLLAKVISLSNTVVCSQKVIQIILHISVCLSDMMYGCINDSNLDSALKSLITPCLRSQQFSREVIKSVIEYEDKKTGLYALSTVFECLSSSSSDYRYWLCDESISNLISCLAMCGNELCRPIHPTSQVKKPVSAYEFTVSRLCAVIATTPAGHQFKQIEKLLYRMLLSPYIHLNLMSIDCWHFSARYSPNHVAVTQVLGLVNVCKSRRLSDTQLQSIQSIICRLVSLLSAENQKRLLTHPDAFLSGILMKRWFDQSHHSEIERLVMESLQTHYEKLTSHEQPSQEHLLYSTEAIARLLQNPLTDTGEIITTSSNLLSEILLQNTNNPRISGCLCLTIQAFSRRQFHPQFIKLLHQLTSATEQPCTRVQICLINSVCHLSTLPTSQDKELVITFYTTMISSSSPCIQLHALESFREFAKSTPYQELINRIANSQKDINQRVVSYCSGTKHKSLKTLSPEDAHETWDMTAIKATLDSRLDQKPVSDNGAVAVAPGDYQGPPAEKRQRLDVDVTLDQVENLMTSIQNQTDTLTMDHGSRLQGIVTRATQIIGSIN